MRTKLRAAFALLASVSVLQIPALAQNEGRAQLRLTIVDETNVPVPNAIVTVFLMQGPRDVNTDEKGVVVVADLPVAMTQWWARSGALSSAEAGRLKAGENERTLDPSLEREHQRAARNIRPASPGHLLPGRSSKSTSRRSAPCPGCGAFFPPHDGPAHRYIGAYGCVLGSVLTVSRSDSPKPPTC